LLGDPEEIPFEFQYQLDVQYAVGRLDFGGDLAAYRHYADNVVAAEAQPVCTSPRAVFLGTANPGDEATALSEQHLVRPLFRRFHGRAVESPWQVLRVAPDKATKANVLHLLSLDPPVSFAFLAGHGLEFDPGHPRQTAEQGALLCQDWDGQIGVVPSGAYVAASDVSETMDLRGMILFLFACHGAGTPLCDEYHRRAFQDRAERIAERPFVASLPQAMLALRRRGALAMVGHVDRAWGLSFLPRLPRRPEGDQSRRYGNTEVFASFCEQLLNGDPVGAAMNYFNLRHAATSTELTYLYEHITDPMTARDAYELAELWTASNDARGYIVLGDPAVRLNAVPLVPEVR
jgi:hypothetical protein